MNYEVFDSKDNPFAECAFLRLLLQQKGMSFRSAERVLEVYDICRRLSDDHERPLLTEYGFENIAADMYNRQPIGDQWREYEDTLFDIKTRALSRCRYHILAKVLDLRQKNVQEDEDTWPSTLK